MAEKIISLVLLSFIVILGFVFILNLITELYFKTNRCTSFDYLMRFYDLSLNRYPVLWKNFMAQHNNVKFKKDFTLKLLRFMKMHNIPHAKAIEFHNMVEYIHIHTKPKNQIRGKNQNTNHKLSRFFRYFNNFLINFNYYYDKNQQLKRGYLGKKPHENKLDFKLIQYLVFNYASIPVISYYLMDLYKAKLDSNHFLYCTFYIWYIKHYLFLKLRFKLYLRGFKFVVSKKDFLI